MNANFKEIYGSVEKMAKANAEQAQAAQARIADVLRDGYRMMSEGMTFSINHTAEAVNKVGRCRSPQELAAVHKEWIEGVTTRLVEDTRSYLSLTSRLMSEAGAVPAITKAAVPVIAPAAAKPAPTAPKAVANPAPASMPTPVIEVAAPAPVPVVEETVAEAEVEEVKAEEAKPAKTATRAPRRAAKAAAPKVEEATPVVGEPAPAAVETKVVAEDVSEAAPAEVASAETVVVKDEVAAPAV